MHKPFRYTKIPLLLLDFQKSGEEGNVVVDDTVGNQSAAFIPYVLVMFRLEAELSKISVGNSSPQLIVALTPIQSALYVATEGQQVDEIEQVDATDDIVIFPKCPFGAIPAGIRTQLTDDHVLGRRLQGEWSDPKKVDTKLR